MDISFLQQTLSEVHLMAPTTGVIIAAVLAAILLRFSGFASGSEIAFFSLSPQDLSELNPEHNPKDAQVKELRDDSERTLATILITNNFVNVTIIMLCILKMLPSCALIKLHCELVMVGGKGPYLETEIVINDPDKANEAAEEIKTFYKENFGITEFDARSWAEIIEA